MNRQPIAYLASEYPAISHTFIFREVQALRGQGFDVKTASIRRTQNAAKMTQAEKAEAEATFRIKNAPPGLALRAHLGLMLSAPGAYVRMACKAGALALKSPAGAFKALAYFAEAGILLHWLRREGVGHVHVHFANPAATVALIAAAGNTVPFSLSVHGPDVFYNVGPNLLAGKVAAARFVRCISFFCQSQVMRLVPFREWPKFHIVRCGVDLGAYGVRAEPDNDIPELLCVGRLVPVKGQHVLLQALGGLRRGGAQFHLTCVGDGPDRTSLEAHCRELGLDDAVTFTGAVGQDAVHAYYDRADVFVLASFAEGLPVVLMEAMAKGIPCVSTRIAAISELIEDAANGFLVHASDVEGLADRLGQLLADRPLRERLGIEARKTVEAAYDLEGNCKRMGELFDEHLPN